MLTQPDMVARHCASAKLTEKAIAYWLKAGNLAQSRAAMTEAATAFGEGLQLLAELPEGCERDGLELELQLALSRSEIATKGYAAQGVGEALAKARQLCGCMTRPPELVSVLYGLWTHALMRTELGQAEQIAEEILQLGHARRMGVGQRETAACRVLHASHGANMRRPDDTSSAGSSYTIPEKTAAVLPSSCPTRR